VEVDVDEVDVGDILLVKTGAKVPVDGTVLSGEGSINEASITGESLPVSKEKGSTVFAGTILDNGTLQIVADRVGEDTTFGKIIELVEEAQDSKSAAERFIDRFSKYYTPAVLVLGLLVWVFSRDIELAITILVLGLPRRFGHRRSGIQCGRNRKRRTPWHAAQRQRSCRRFQPAGHHGV
jgi:Cd2+/Zn2+-exporting ATPase